MADLASDNTAATHPRVMDALIAANEGRAPAYGRDDWTARLEAVMREITGRAEARVFPVFNGSACNGLALSAMMQPFEAVIAHEYSHIHHDECGLPEFFTGGKVMALPGPNGKLRPGDVERQIVTALEHAPHTSRPRVVSLTQSTECGTVYRPLEIATLAQVAHRHGLRVHMDGARIANAVAHLGCPASEVLEHVDVLSFGGTKAGAMLAEAVVVLDDALGETLAYRQKRAGQLPSKARYVSAQLLALLEDGLWLRLGAHANAMAQRLAEGLGAIGGVCLAYPVEANAVFVHLPRALAEALEARGHRFYRWPQSGEDAYRLVTSFMTTEADIEGFIADARAGG